MTRHTARGVGRVVLTPVQGQQQHTERPRALAENLLHADRSLSRGLVILERCLSLSLAYFTVLCFKILKPGASSRVSAV